MTNQISKAREALRELFKMTDDPKACYHHYNTVKDLLTTLSTVDAGKLGEALEKVGTELNFGNPLYPEIITIGKAARTLHGIIGEKI